MITEQDIVAMLKNGEKPDDIAQKLVNTLNKGQELYRKEREEKEKDAQKVKDMQHILDLIHDFILDHYCTSNEDINKLHESFNEIKAEDIIASIEELGAFAVQLTASLNDIEKLVSPNKSQPKSKSMTKDDANFVIQTFLKSMGI